MNIGIQLKKPQRDLFEQWNSTRKVPALLPGQYFDSGGHVSFEPFTGIV